MWFEKTNNKKWKYKTTETIKFKIFPKNCYYEFFSDSGRMLAKMDFDGTITVFPGFAWDGATFAPDFKKVLKATVIHDLMCQLVNQPYWLYDRLDADFVFYDNAKKDKFIFADIYFISVLVFGFIHENDKPKKGITIKNYILDSSCIGKQTMLGF